MATYGEVMVDGVTCGGKSVTVKLPPTGVKQVIVTPWGVINLHVTGVRDGDGRIDLCIEKYGEPVIPFEITDPGMYRIKNGYLSLPLEAFAEMQHGFQAVVSLAIDTRRKLNGLMGLPEDDGLDFDAAPEGAPEA